MRKRQGLCGTVQTFVLIIKHYLSIIETSSSFNNPARAIGRSFLLYLEHPVSTGPVLTGPVLTGRHPSRDKLMKNQSSYLKLVFIAIAVVCFSLIILSVGCAKKGPLEEAKYILEKSGVKGGLIVHINCGKGALTHALKANDSYIVHGLDEDASNVKDAREFIASKKNYGPISADHLTGNRLPYIDNLVNLIVSENLGSIPKDEVMRVLAPNGVFISKGWFGWSKTVKPRPAEMDEWNQYLYSSEGNPVSNDEIVGPMKHYQWIGSPKWARHHDTTASMSALVSANGRIFYIMDEGPKESIQLPSENFLIARDAFSGTILWKRPIAEWQDHLFPLKSGPAYLPRRLVAVGDRVYVTLGINAPLSELDAVTGKTLRDFAKTDQTSEVIFSENTLFLVVGRPEQNTKLFAPKSTYVWDNFLRAKSEWAWGKQYSTIMAIDAKAGKIKWEKQAKVAPLSLSTDSKAVYFYDGANMICLNRKNGDHNWQAPIVIEDLNDIDTAYSPRIVVYKDVVIFSGSLKSKPGRAFQAGKMVALSAKDGRKLWEADQEPSGHFTPEDLFVIDDLVWTGTTAMVGDKGNFVGRDIHTGEVKSEFASDANVYFFHQRCYISKATKKYIIPSRTGTEFVDLKNKHWTINHYTRGGCIYGIMPSNGLIYSPSNACACYIEAKLNGFTALAAAHKSEPNLAAATSENRLQKGPAYDTTISGNLKDEDWPTYRHDSQRSGFAPTKVLADLEPEWSTNLGGKLSSPIVVDQGIYVAKADSHTVYALDTLIGKVSWSYTAGGRVDSPPTYYKGRVLFGSADGYVYCLKALDGALIWRFRAAPIDRRMMAYEQLESVWPVSGSVLIQNDKVYCVAGRSVFLDGGLRLLQLNPVTGEKLAETVLDEKDPTNGKNLHDYVQELNMPVGLPDVLSSDGKYLYMRSQQFDLDGNRKQIAVRDVKDQSGDGTHIFSPLGFLDDSQFSRSYMMYGKSVKSGWGGWEVMGKLTPSGRLISVNGDTVFGYERKPEFLSESIVLEYRLYAARKSGDPEAIQRITAPDKEPVNPFDKKMKNYAGDWKLRQGIPMAEQSAVQVKWLVDKPPLQVRAMVLAGQVLFISGPPDVFDEEEAFFKLDDAQIRGKLAEQSALFKGKEGAVMWAVSAANGKKLAEFHLDSLPVWDGMAASRGKLYMTTLKGDVISFAGKTKGNSETAQKISKLIGSAK
jgi:outer membrane protein assembly factor BamB